MKYIIEIEDEPKNGLWKAKEFDTLVFDAEGLSRLRTIQDDYMKMTTEDLEFERKVAYEEGHRAAMDIVEESCEQRYKKGLYDGMLLLRERLIDKGYWALNQTIDEWKRNHWEDKLL